MTKEVSTDDSTWYDSADSIQGVNPGTDLFYRISITNSGTGDATEVIASDPLPDYTTYIAASGKENTSASTYAAAAVVTDADVPASDGYDWNVTATSTVTYNVGTLTPASSSVFFFKVTVNP